MNDQEFRAVLDWFMCSDPWPVERDDDSHEIVTNWLNNEAQVRGYDSWVVAFHKFNPAARPTGGAA
jgi:hypothetical protein